jgi:hypothetical protein
MEEQEKRKGQHKYPFLTGISYIAVGVSLLYMTNAGPSQTEREKSMEWRLTRKIIRMKDSLDSVRLREWNWRNGIAPFETEKEREKRMKNRRVVDVKYKEYVKNTAALIARKNACHAQAPKKLC